MARAYYRHAWVWAGTAAAFAVTAGSLPPGLTMSASSGSSTVITGNPTQTGTFNFTIKATDGGLTSTLAYQITITVQGPPDQLLCTAANGGFLINGACVLPDAIAGQPYQGHLPTSHNAGGTVSIVAGALPPGLSLPATFGASGDILGGTASQTDTGNGYTFTMQLTDFAGQHATQQFSLTIDPPLQISTTPLPAGTAGVKYSHDLIAHGGAPPYSWFVVNSINELPPGLTLGTTAPDFNNVLTGTPTQAGTFSFPMQVQDSQDNWATGTVTITINP